MKNFKKGVICLSLGLMLGLGVVGCNTKVEKPKNDVKASGYIAIDINPSVEFVTDANGKVSSFRGTNKDAQTLLVDVNLKGLTVSDATKQVVALSEEIGYLNKDNKNVNVYVVAGKEEDEQKLKKEAEAGAKEGSKNAVVKDASKNLAKEVEELKKTNPTEFQNLTPAKLRLIKSIMEYDNTKTISELNQYKVDDLKDMLDDIFEDMEDMVSDTLEDKFNLEYAKRTAEIDNKINAFYGEEYVSKIAIYNKLLAKEEEIENSFENLELKEEDIVALVTLLELANRDLLVKDGKITPESVDEYLEILENKWDETDDEALEEKLELALDSAEEIIEKYDSEDATFTETIKTDLNAIINNAEVVINNLDELEEYIETIEDEIEEIEENTVLTEEDKLAIEKLESEKKDIKLALKEELKGDVKIEQEKLRKEKENKKNESKK